MLATVTNHPPVPHKECFPFLSLQQGCRLLVHRPGRGQRGAAPRSGTARSSLGPQRTRPKGGVDAWGWVTLVLRPVPGACGQAGRRRPLVIVMAGPLPRCHPPPTGRPFLGTSPRWPCPVTSHFTGGRTFSLGCIRRALWATRCPFQWRFRESSWAWDARTQPSRSVSQYPLTGRKGVSHLDPRPQLPAAGEMRPACPPVSGLGPG